MRPAQSSRYGVSLVLAAGMAACGSDAMMAPQPAPTVAGRWNYTANDLAGDFLGSPFGCEYDLVMQISQSGSALAGSYSQAVLRCALGGSSQIVDFGGGDVVAGSIVRDSVRFDFDSETIRNVGTIVGDRMNGSVEIVLVVQMNSDIDTVQVAGGWTATR